MTSTQHKKIVLGSTLRAHKKAKITGQICLQDLDLLDIVLGLATFCEISLNFETQQCLEKIGRTIQSQNKDICTYRNTRLNDTKFIN